MIFKYRARDERGRLVVGSVEAASLAEVRSGLRRNALLPLEIDSEKRLSLLSRMPDFWRLLREIGTVPLREKSLFFNQLAVLTEAGIALGAALRQAVASCRCRPLRRKAAVVARKVDSGRQLSEALEEVSLVGSIDKSVLAVGEETGHLPQALRRIAEHYERRERLRGKIISALTYPTLVLVFCGAVLMILFRYVLPRYRQIFADMHLPLPPSTERVFRFGANLPIVLAVSLGAFLLLWAAASALARFRETKTLVGKLALHLPLYGPLRKRAELARGLGLLAILLDSGVPLLRSLELVAKSTRNGAVEHAFNDLMTTAKEGGSLGERAAAIPLFREFTAPLLAAGEQSGRLAEQMNRAAAWYEAGLTEGVKRLSSLLEPLLILFVGAATAIVVFAVFAPVLDAVRSLTAAI